MDLENARASAVKLRDLLAAELENAQNERQILRDLDTPALFARASQRSHFIAEAARLDRSLAAALSPGSSSSADVDLPAALAHLRERSPEDGQRMLALLSDIRSRAAALHEVDKLNLQLAARALATVDRCVETLRPTARAYDRRGLRSSAPATAMISSKG